MSTLPSCTAPGNDYRMVHDLPEASAPHLTVVIPVYNRVDLLDRTIAGLRNQTLPSDRFDVRVADDGSSEDVAGVVASHADSLPITLVHQTHDGFGLAKARNLGAAEAQGDVLVFLDADCIPAPNLLERHVFWQSRASNLVVAGTRRDIDSTAFSPRDIASARAKLADAVGDADDNGGYIPNDWRRAVFRKTRKLLLGDAGFRAAIGANLSVRRDRFEAVGGYSEDFDRWGGEDTEFNWRVWNDGAFFVPDTLAMAYHQVQHDPPGAVYQRQASRDQITALMADRVPHRFYRTLPGPFFSVPKVTWWVQVETADEADLAWRECSYATFADSEIIFSGPASSLARLERVAALSPRVTVVTGDGPEVVERTLRMARGELVALLDGRTRINRDVLTKAVTLLDDESRAATVRTGYRFPEGDRYLHRRDLAAVDAAVGRHGLPLFAVARRRELMKEWELLRSPAELWAATIERDTHSKLMVREPATVTAAAPATRHGVTARELAATGPKELARKAVRAARRDKSGGERRPGRTDERIPVAYVGLTGKNNLGDDAVLAAVEQLMPWAHFGTDHADPRLLMVGGGTLINGRSYYLNKMLRQDVPTVDRVMFGTGVRQPEFWGVTEPMADWFSFLDSAILAGVRGPDSIANLRTLGYDGEVKILGDPALSLVAPSDAERVEGRVVVCPLNTAGNLHGGDDGAVLDAITKTIGRLRSQGHEVVMLSAYPEDDRWIIGIMEELNTPLPYFAGYTDLEESLRLLASADLVIGERLHAAILAAACLTPFVALEYRPKVLDFTKSIDQVEATVRTDEMGRLDEVVDHLVANRDEVSGAIAGPVTAFRALQRDAANTLELFTKEP